MTNLADAGLGFVKEFKEIVTRHFISITLFIGIVSLLLLQLPKSVVDIFYIDDLRTANNELIGMMSFLSLAMTTFAFLHRITTRISAKIKDERHLKKEKQEKIAMLRNLTPGEHTFLRTYVEKKTQSVSRHFNNNTARGLEKKGILYTLIETSSLGANAYYYLKPWAYACLLENPTILEDETL